MPDSSDKEVLNKERKTVSREEVADTDVLSLIQVVLVSIWFDIWAAKL